MKKVIKASRKIYDKAFKEARARKILNAADALFDILDDTPVEILDQYDLKPLYAELNDTIYDLAHALRNDDLSSDYEY